MAAVGDAPPVAEESAFSAKYKVVDSDQDAVTFGFEHQGPQTPIYDMCKLFLCCTGPSVSAREGGGRMQEWRVNGADIHATHPASKLQLTTFHRCHALMIPSHPALDPTG